MFNYIYNIIVTTNMGGTCKVIVVLIGNKIVIGRLSEYEEMNYGLKLSGILFVRTIWVVVEFDDASSWMTA